MISTPSSLDTLRPRLGDSRKERKTAATQTWCLIDLDSLDLDRSITTERMSLLSTREGPPPPGSFLAFTIEGSCYRHSCCRHRRSGIPGSLVRLARRPRQTRDGLEGDEHRLGTGMAGTQTGQALFLFSESRDKGRSTEGYGFRLDGMDQKLLLFEGHSTQDIR